MKALLGQSTLIYISLLTVRAWFAWFGTGYIHPDEYFQNGEVMAGRVFGYHILQTWEWHSTFPVRSALPPVLTTGIPFMFMKLLSGQTPSPSVLFHLERTIAFTLSLLLDYSVTVLVRNPTERSYALLLLASSHVIHTFQVRLFSNSLEAILVALCLVALYRYIEDYQQFGASKGARKGCKSRGAVYLHFLAVLFVLGTFTRPTFVAFAFPVALQTLRYSILKASSQLSSNYAWARTMFPPLLTAAMCCLSIAVFDTWYFHGEFKTLTLTPLNFLSYNLRTSNLAEHGVHPRWLHLFVNLPMIVGPGVLWYGILFASESFRSESAKNKKKRAVNSIDVVCRTSMYIILSSLVILSLQPHQEPRFLTPLVAPSIVLIANSKRVLRLGKIYWVTWVASNIAFSLLFGVLHQGAVIPSLLHLHDEILQMSQTLNVNIVFWKTYMPPRHFLGISDQGGSSDQIFLADMAGAPASTLAHTLQNISQISEMPALTVTYLVTPPQARYDLPPQISRCLSHKKQLYPHLDLDHLEESLQVGWRDGLSLGIYVVDAICVRSSNGEIDN